jgi:hypothetical protein
MRTLLAWALVLVVTACADRPERADGSGALATIPAGQDPIVLRVPQDGGLVTALDYPALDSVVWRSSYRLPALDRALGYDPEDGYLTAVDTSGRPVRLDLRLGAVALPGAAGARQHASADGGTLFAVDAEGRIVRHTPVGDEWRLDMPGTPDALIPLRDGSLLVARRDGADLLVQRLRPPDTIVVDSLRIDADADSASVFGVAVGDRAFVSAGEHVYSLRTRDFVQDVSVDIGERVRTFVTSPSGDRVFVLAGDGTRLHVVDRFSGDVVERVTLPAAGTALRMDALGRALLVRGPDEIVWVVDVGTSSLVGPLRSTWRGDLPLVLPDGAVALVHGDTVALASSLDLGTVRAIPEGARDFWYAMRWNGFRPRATGLDEPVRFRSSGSSARSEGAPGMGVPGMGTGGDSASRDSLGQATTDSVTGGSPTRDSAAGTVTAADRVPIYTVQLAAVLSEALAREAAAGINIEGRTPRISTSVRDGRTLYRVVLGPFSSREEAERIGKASGRSYWVFEGAP